jgi:hypothetical protein
MPRRFTPGSVASLHHLARPPGCSEIRNLDLQPVGGANTQAINQQDSVEKHRTLSSKRGICWEAARLRCCLPDRCDSARACRHEHKTLLVSVHGIALSDCRAVAIDLIRNVGEAEVSAASRSALLGMAYRRYRCVVSSDTHIYGIAWDRHLAFSKRENNPAVPAGLAHGAQRRQAKATPTDSISPALHHKYYTDSFAWLSALLVRLLRGGLALG